MKKLEYVTPEFEIYDYILEDYQTGEKIKFDSEAEALYHYACIMRVVGAWTERRLLLRQRHGIAFPVLYDQNVTYEKALPYL